MVIRHGGLTAAERVKKAVEVCKQECSPYCPYWTEGECNKPMIEDCMEAIAERDERIAIKDEALEALEKRCNALEALEQYCKALEASEKRNEPIKPTLNESHSYVSDAFKCGKCGHTIRFHAKYCEDCGQAVKWE